MTKLKRIAKILDGMAEREFEGFCESEGAEADTHAGARSAYERAAVVVRSFIDEET